MSNETLKSLPQQCWMSKSHRPPLSTWLQPQMDTLTESRLKALGNVVVPAMANLAINVMSHSPV